MLVRNFIGMIYRFIPFSIRYGDFYNKYLTRIKFFVKLEQQKIKTETDKLLIKQINYAIYHIPFYQKFTHIVSIDELSKLPIVNKIIISENFKAFLNPQLSHKGLKSNTGGSSGTPFSFFIEKGVTRPKEAAHFNWYWKKYGYIHRAKVLMIRGKSLRNNADFEYQAIGNKLVVSCYNLHQESIKEIHTQIAKFNPKFIHAYPSSLLVFTKELQLFLNNNPLKFKIETIFLGSENLFDQDKIYFETFYNSKIVNWYGHSECLIHGGKCELSGDYHFYSFYGYLELVDEKDSIIEEPGIEGRIVATGFDNSVMPLIRYDTGDWKSVV